MFDIEEFYAAAHNGDEADTEGFSEYVRSFDNVVLWGAGNLGTVIGERFLQMGLPVSAYWDLRASEIGRLHGIRVLEPFTGGFDREGTLVVFCITNVFITSIVERQLQENGYKHVLVGEEVYEGLICPFDKATGVDIKVCRDLPMCNVCSCLRLDKMIQNEHARKAVRGGYENLHFPNVTFIINQKCTLSCKYCYSYVNNYPDHKRVNFPLERIEDDIDRFFDAVDSVTLVPVIGGEPFLHPDISAIVKKFLEKKNFGVLNITTNGICKITPEHLEGFRDDRARVFFSNYLSSLSPKQQEIFNKNIEFVASQGVATLVYNSTPQWTVPVTLNNKNFSTEYITAMKANCMATPSNGKYVKNGRFYPCTIIDSVHNLDVADYAADYVDIAATASAAQLRDEIRRVMALPYYETCRHCGNREQLTENAGVQGFIDYVHVQ